MLGPVELVSEVDSTNRVLLDRARGGAPAGAVLVADHQTAGRGRLDRRWESPPGASLLVSVVLRPSLSVEQAHLVTMAAGIAAVRACHDVAGAEVGLKWPNDVVNDDRKLAGILAESLVVGARLDAVVVGMGLNLTWAPEGAAHLQELATQPFDRAALLDAWLTALDGLLEGPAAAVTDAYRSACTTIGRRVRVEAADAWEGLASDVDAAGRLIVDDRPVSVGDVIHLRAV